jgi:hypothetical protein
VKRWKRTQLLFRRLGPRLELRDTLGADQLDDGAKLLDPGGEPVQLLLADAIMLLT